MNQQQNNKLGNRKQKQDALNSMKKDFLTIESNVEQNVKPLPTFADEANIAPEILQK